MSPEDFDQGLGRLLDKAATELGEHFDCVVILATNSLPNDRHSTFVRCTGNNYTGWGLANCYIERQKERAQNQVYDSQGPETSDTP